MSTERTQLSVGGCSDGRKEGLIRYSESQRHGDDEVAYVRWKVDRDDVHPLNIGCCSSVDENGQVLACLLLHRGRDTFSSSRCKTGRVGSQ